MDAPKGRVRICCELPVSSLRGTTTQKCKPRDPRDFHGAADTAHEVRAEMGHAQDEANSKKKTKSKQKPKTKSKKKTQSKKKLKTKSKKKAKSKKSEDDVPFMRLGGKSDTSLLQACH
ncbi:hypothetical protein WJX82_007487 [Trebouxia sp. C0006]